VCAPKAGSQTGCPYMPSSPVSNITEMPPYIQAVFFLLKPKVRRNGL